MIIKKAYKTKLKLTLQQKIFFTQCCNISKFVYNWALNDRINKHKKGEKTSFHKQTKDFNSIKKEQFPWAINVPYKIIELSIKNLHYAYENFFMRIKKKETEKGFPRFKSRFDREKSFSLRGSIKVSEDKIKLPCIGWVRLAEKNYLPRHGIKIFYATISEKANNWFVSLQVEEEIKDSKSSGKKALGIDMGIKSLITCSNGKVFDNKKILEKYEKKLKRLNRELSRKKKGGNNWQKTKNKINELHYKISNKRGAVLHNISRNIIYGFNPGCICIEDLNIKGMLKNKKLSKSISDASLSDLKRQLCYKAEWRNIPIIKADRWFPSSKKCSICGNIKNELKLTERIYKCDKCGNIMDRDLNAAINLKKLADDAAVSAC